MAIDPVTVAKVWMAVRPIKRLKERRKAKRAEREQVEQASPAEIEEAKFMGSEIIKSLLRHWGSATAGIVVGTGVAGPEDASVFVNVAIGLVIYLVTQGWSILRKVGRAKAKPEG